MSTVLATLVGFGVFFWALESAVYGDHVKARDTLRKGTPSQYTLVAKEKRRNGI